MCRRRLGAADQKLRCFVHSRAEAEVFYRRSLGSERRICYASIKTARPNLAAPVQLRFMDLGDSTEYGAGSEAGGVSTLYLPVPDLKRTC